jgi:hypothetical protein
LGVGKIDTKHTKNHNFGIFFESLGMEIFYGRLVYFMTTRCVMCSYGIYFPILVCCAKKNLATLIKTEKKHASRRKPGLPGFSW